MELERMSRDIMYLLYLLYARGKIEKNERIKRKEGIGVNPVETMVEPSRERVINQDYEEKNLGKYVDFSA